MDYNITEQEQRKMPFFKRNWDSAWVEYSDILKHLTMPQLHIELEKINERIERNMRKFGRPDMIGGFRGHESVSKRMFKDIIYEIEKRKNYI